MKKILLSQKKFAYVDDDDFELLSKNNWYIYVGYAGRKEKGKAILMHRVILKASKGQCVDHIDGDRLNNQRSNLRICTHAQNLRNKGISKNNKSGLKGVRWNKYDNRWTTQISIDGKNVFLGNFLNKEDAIKVYNDAAIKYFGEFAYINK